MGMKRKSVAEYITGCGCACVSFACVCALQQAPESGRGLCVLMYLYSQVGDMVARYALTPPPPTHPSKDECMDVTGAGKHAFIMLFLICISIRRGVKFMCLDDILLQLSSL